MHEAFKGTLRDNQQKATKLDLLDWFAALAS